MRSRSLQWPPGGLAEELPLLPDSLRCGPRDTTICGVLEVAGVSGFVVPIARGYRRSRACRGDATFNSICRTRSEPPSRQSSACISSPTCLRVRSRPQLGPFGCTWVEWVMPLLEPSGSDCLATTRRLYRFKMPPDSSIR